MLHILSCDSRISAVNCTHLMQWRVAPALQAMTAINGLDERRLAGCAALSLKGWNWRFGEGPQLAACSPSAKGSFRPIPAVSGPVVSDPIADIHPASCIARKMGAASLQRPSAVSFCKLMFRQWRAPQCACAALQSRSRQSPAASEPTSPVRAPRRERLQPGTDWHCR